MNHIEVADAVSAALGPESLVYVATPYSKYAGGLTMAAREAARNAAALMKRGVQAFSPIAHTHPIAVAGGIDPLDHQFWLGQDAWFIKNAAALVVVKMEGWDRSVGVAHEINRFAGRPVFMMDPLPPVPRVIGLMGYGGAGKSTVAGILRARHGFVTHHIKTPFANMLRTMLRDFGYDGETVERWIDGDLKRAVIPELGQTSTQVQQDLGTAWGRKCIRPSIWTDLWEQKVRSTLAAGGCVVQESVRFPEEAATIRALGGILIRVDRPGYGPLDGHESEAIPAEPDITIDNGAGLDELGATVASVLV